MASARGLSASEVSAVDAWLSRPLADLFFDQPDHDQRHGYDAALSVIAHGHSDPGVVIAALLHDVGKRHARLGLIGRSVASLMILAGVPLPERVVTYRDHGMVGAVELGEAGAPSIAIDFALHHHHRRPETIRPEVWDVLIAGDQPPPLLGGHRGRLSRLRSGVFSWFDARKRREPPITSDNT